jgi:hypothetical protein
VGTLFHRADSGVLVSLLSASAGVSIALLCDRGTPMRSGGASLR